MINLRALNYFTTASTKNCAMNLVATKFHARAPGKIINYTNRDISTWLRTKLICTCTREHPEKTEQRLITVWHFNVETGSEGAATWSNFDGALTSLPTGAEMKPLWKRNEETWRRRWRISRLADDLYGEEGKKFPDFTNLKDSASPSGDVEHIRQERVLYWLLIARCWRCHIHSH